MTRACIVQLPFPSTLDPDPDLSAYYVDYDRQYRARIPEYFVPSEGLWELPLWVAHLTALLDVVGLDSVFCNLSTVSVDEAGCTERILSATAAGDMVLLSPLAQNFDLALGVARRLGAAGRLVVIGGNMAPLTPPGAAHLVHRGQLDVGFARRLASAQGVTSRPAVRGLVANRIDWIPNYRHLVGYSGRVPLIRINASHGCLYECSFCGDAWSRQLTLVELPALAAELDELARRFPDVKLVYVGDKTFGQSRQAVENLLQVFADRPGYRMIVQTHVLQVRDWVLRAMRSLGVVVAELGFESADTGMLASMDKRSRGLEHYADRIQALRESGIRVILNLMGGLDEETERSHELTVTWLEDHSSLLWLFNVYNFVPYPLAPGFAHIRGRIFNWRYADWREDAPPVYAPRHVTAERSWEMFKAKVAVAHRIVRESAAG